MRPRGLLMRRGKSQHDGRDEIADVGRALLQICDAEEDARRRAQAAAATPPTASGSSVPVPLEEPPLGKWTAEAGFLRLTSAEGDTQVVVVGKALTNDDIVEFIKNLQKSKYFSFVTLQESVESVEEGVTVYSFKISMTVKV